MATAAKQDTLASAMAAAFAEIEAATKGANNPHFKSKYADLGAVIDAIKPALIKHGLFFAQHCRPAEDGVSVETVLYHSAGERESLGTLYVPANKRDAQGFGSALTYARRYALMTAFGVPAEDDDGNAAVKSAPRNGHANDRNGNGVIDEAQFAMLVTLIEQSGTDTRAFCEHFKVPSVKALPASRFDDARTALEIKLRQKGAGQTEAA
jgi:hypothetical protein